MPTPTFQPPEGVQSGPQMVDYIYRLIRDLNYLMSNLDDLNINRLDAKVIIAGSITALQIMAGTITADKLTVSQLSAIAADLGSITAGTVTGALIQTKAASNYPRAFLATTGNQFGVEQNADDFIYILPGSPPVLRLSALLGAMSITQSGATSNFTSTGNLSILATGTLDLKGIGGVKINTGTSLDTVTQANSVAATVAALVTDFNTLLTNLRNMNILA